MKHIYTDLTKTIGNTPLVQLNAMAKGCSATILAKLESANPLFCVKVLLWLLPALHVATDSS